MAEGGRCILLRIRFVGSEDSNVRVCIIILNGKSNVFKKTCEESVCFQFLVEGRPDFYYFKLYIVF